MYVSFYIHKLIQRYGFHVHLFYLSISRREEGEHFILLRFSILLPLKKRILSLLLLTSLYKVICLTALIYGMRAVRFCNTTSTAIAQTLFSDFFCIAKGVMD